MSAIYKKSLREKLDERAIRDSAGCLLWTGATNGSGYGVIGYNNKTYLTHRAAYGPVPKGFHLHHTCRKRTCMELTHLVLVSEKEHNTESSHHLHYCLHDRFAGPNRSAVADQEKNHG